MLACTLMIDLVESINNPPGILREMWTDRSKIKLHLHQQVWFLFLFLKELTE